MLSLVAAETACISPAKDDRQLLDRYICDGDRESLGELFRRHSSMAYRVALLVLNDAPAAEAAVQAAFMEAMEQSGTIRKDADVRPWILSFVIRAARTRKPNELPRKRHKHVSFDAGGKQTLRLSENPVHG